MADAHHRRETPTGKSQIMSDIPPIIALYRPEAPGPVAPTERIETLDVLRGFALFGILVVNMAVFSWPIYQVLMGNPVWTTRTDAIADWVVRFLAEGKFFPLFSFLFGMGFAIQMERAAARGADFGGRYARRLVTLLGIGLAHAFLIWEGDILVMYSLCGFLLLAFRNCKPRTLLVWAAACLLIAVVIYALLWALLTVGSLVPEIAKEIEQGLAEEGELEARLAAENLRIFARGSVAEIFAQRAQNVLYLYRYAWVYAPTVFAMFLLGLCAGRRRILQNVEEHLGFVRRALIWGLCLGLPANAVYAVAYGLSDPLNINLVWVITGAALIVGGPALCFFYVATITLMLRRDVWRRRLRPLAAAGRMALTNYLCQSLVCTTIFYSYGLGWYGSVGRAAGLGLAVVIYATQIPLSVWWLKRFRFGPVEWLWRTLTYGKRQPMRL